VQRVPVRIILDPKDLQDHPLRVGLSVTAEVDVRDQSGPLVTTRIGAGTIRANTGEESGPVADAMIARILQENGGAAR
jgi:membrane fusion protein (multidrug efflux system)